MAAATSIAAQLQAIKSLVKADTEQHSKRPFTRPSLLFDPKEAADIDIDSIHSIALSGLEVLVKIDERFRNYKNDLFSHKSREMDRELMGLEENDRINSSIASYLRLLSGHLQLPSAFKTLEYLIRRYKIHVYNIEELILSALPHHDTHAFVRIVQLIDFGNSRWRFLEGVKVSGAAPPREVIVQQCVRDSGVLDVLCDYATPSKKYQPSMPVIRFCTAVVIEVLGHVASVDSDLVKRILPFVNSGLQSGAKGCPNYKAGSLMVVGLLANRAALSPKLVKTFVRLIAEVAHAHAEDSTDLQWFQLSIMALINVVQLQSVEALPKKAVDVLKEIKDLPGILLGLTTKFNIDKFLTLLLESLVDYGISDHHCKLVLASIVETVPIKGLVGSVVSRLLSSCVRSSQNADASELSELGSWAKKILIVLNEKYPDELHSAVHKVLEDKKVNLNRENSVIETLSRMLDGNLHSSLDLSDSRIWLALEHPKAEIRRTVLSSLDVPAILSNKADSSQRLVTIQDAITRSLYDDDLSVVLASLSLDRLPELVNSSNLLRVFRDVLHRCTKILWLGASEDLDKARDVAILCVKHAVSSVKGQPGDIQELGAMIFPLLLVLPKTRMLNLETLELAKDINWPLYKNLKGASYQEENRSRHDQLSVINQSVISSLADSFSTNAEELLPWLIRRCNDSDLSKTLLFFVLLQSFLMQENATWFSSLSGACFSFLKNEWRALENMGDLLPEKEIDSRVLDASCGYFLEQLYEFNLKQLNARLLVSLLWRSLKAFMATIPSSVSVEDQEWFRMVQDLYVFFAESNLKHFFKEHRHYLVLNCKMSPIHFVQKFIAEGGYSPAVQVESLHSLALMCSDTDETIALQLLGGFPSVFVPLTSDISDVRKAAMNYIEALSTLCSRVKRTGKNGNSESWSTYVDELLTSLVKQKKFVLSNTEFLPAFLASILSPSFQSLLIPQDVGQRFEKSSAEAILSFILRYAMKLPGYAKLKILSLLKQLGSGIVHDQEVNSLLHKLLQQRLRHHFGVDKSSQKLSNIDVDITCLLLEICCMPVSADEHISEDYLLMALRIDGVPVDDPAVVRPCVTVLHNLTTNIYSRLSDKARESLFKEILHLYHHAHGDVQNAAKDAISRLSISCSMVSHLLDTMVAFEHPSFGSVRRKKKKSLKLTGSDTISSGNALNFLSSLLDVLLLKKDIQDRALLIGPLFQLLTKIFSKEWVHVDKKEELVQASSDACQPLTSAMCYIQQTTLLILEDIIASLSDVSLSDNIRDKIGAGLLVECARSATDVTTCNHVFSLFATIARVMPNKVLNHIPDIFSVLGQLAVDQSDAHSMHVLESFIAAVVPCWLSQMHDADKLLQIFVNVIPSVGQHKRLSIVTHLLKSLGERKGLGSLLVLLFLSLASRKQLSSSVGEITDFITSAAQREWEYTFAAQICEQYSCIIWLPSLVSLLKQSQRGYPEHNFVEILLALKFILDKLRDPEFVFKLQSGEDPEMIQGTLTELVEQVVCCWQLVEVSRKKANLVTALKKELKDTVHAVLMAVTKAMNPASFFQGIIKLLGSADNGVQKKALQLLCETLKDTDVGKPKRVKERNTYVKGSWDSLGTSALDSLRALCLEILRVVDDPNTSLRSRAISSLEVLAHRFPSNHDLFGTCLASVVKNVLTDDIEVASSCLRTSGALINVLGTKALPELPQIMDNVLKKFKFTDLCSTKSTLRESIMLSILVALEALLEKLGAFLNPYLDDIIELLVLHPEYTSESNEKLRTKADTVRTLLTQNIPVRLVLPPILNIYQKAVNSGDLSLSVAFSMLSNLVSRMDRSAVNSHYDKIYDLCLLALDVRRQHLPSVKHVSVVEKHVVNSMITLTMKLTETMFKPLFIRTIDWAEANVEDGVLVGGTNMDRAISFYILVNKLAENHRSLFVPYFKYLLPLCIRYLTDDDTNNASRSRKKKKAKLQQVESRKSGASDGATLEKWHMRALVLSSLHKCFLYDTGSLKFLDSSNFQLLLKPIVSQLVEEPPTSLDNHPDVPSVKEVDDLLVSCVGQMAVTAGSDLLWKPLNYEVLMQTRSEMVRSRVLGLRIVKYLVEHLKEEYLVLLAETIPFLAELIEDVEPTVKTLAQEILKELESMSGESLHQYF